MKKYKYDIIWVFTTVLIIFLISLFQMFSRAITLDKVDRTNFNLIYNFYNEYNLSKVEELSKTLSPLLTQKKYALFQVAIVGKNFCNEITTHYYNKPLICDVLKDKRRLNIFNNYASKNKNNEIFELKSENITTAEREYESYQFKKFKNSNNWLVAKARFYYADSSFERFKYFFTNRYLQSNGLYKIYIKGKFILYFISVISFILWVLSKQYYRRQLREYTKNKQKQLELHKNWEKQHDILNILLHEQYETDKALERNSTQDFNERSKILIKEISKHREKLKNIEDEEYNLKMTIVNQINRLEIYLKDIEKNKIVTENIEIHKLWNSSTTWRDRKSTESIVTESNIHLPFTITLGFIVFEQTIRERTKNSELDLLTSINSLIETAETKSKLHDIRKARNKWFHNGAYPNTSTINNLIMMLNSLQKNPNFI